MDIELERRAFETWLEENHPVAGFNVTENECGRYVHRATRMRWEAWLAAKAQATPEGFVLVSNDQFESLSEFKDLYKRAIINAKKRKDQINWAHVAGLGVDSGRAVKLCKELGINPSATNMHAAEAQEQNHD